MEYQGFISTLNPVAKLVLIFIPVIWVTFFFDPLTPVFLLILGVLLNRIFGKIPVRATLKYLLPFSLLTLGFIIFLLIAKGFNPEGTVSFWVFRWTLEDIFTSVSLGLRIPVFAVYAFMLVKTTDPAELVRSFIMQLHIPYSVGYAILSAYRFAPTLPDEIGKIRMAHQVRGVAHKKGILGGFAEFKEYLLPLLVSTIRQGERIALAMDGRAFRAYKERTYYKETHVYRQDILSISVMMVLCFGVWGLVHLCGF